MEEELKFRDWLRRTYGVQDYEAFRNTQAEEIAIRYMEHCVGKLKQKSSEFMTEKMKQDWIEWAKTLG